VPSRPGTSVTATPSAGRTETTATELAFPTATSIAKMAGPSPTNVRVRGTPPPGPIGGSCSIEFEVTWERVPAATGYTVYGVPGGQSPRLGPDVLSFAFISVRSLSNQAITRQIAVGASFADRPDGVSAPVTISTYCRISSDPTI
jgi:hypothetical protein